MDRSGALHFNSESGDSRGGGGWSRPPDDSSPGARLQAEEIGLAIGRRLRQRRRELGATQKEIGRRTGISYQQIQRFENGALRLSAAMLWKLAVALDVSVTYLFGV
jgi:DNA-binding XRE family transcriptional regulator